MAVSSPGTVEVDREYLAALETLVAGYLGESTPSKDDYQGAREIVKSHDRVSALESDSDSDIGFIEQ